MLGARNYIPYMTSWLPDFASTNNAFILSADYRLLPAAKSTDILADIESLWTWIHSALSIVITNRLPGHTVDLTQILVQGASAGGFCATHLALSHPSEVRALIAVYAMLDMYADYYVKDPAISRPILGTPKEASSSGEDVDANIQETKEERPTSKTGIEKKLVLPPFLGVCGRVLELFDGKDQLDSPMGRLQAGEKLPNRVYVPAILSKS
jgi:acetyl esterase/lipase